MTGKGATIAVEAVKTVAAVHCYNLKRSIKNKAERVFLSADIHQATHISLGRGQTELNKANFGLFHSGHTSVGNSLGQHKAVYQLTVINGASKHTTHTWLSLAKIRRKCLNKSRKTNKNTHPSFLMILMSCRSTPVAVAGSMTRITASTLMGASRFEYCDTTLEHSDVVALLSSVSRSLSCTGWLMPVSTSTPLSTAFWNDSEMMVGWIPGRWDK